MLEDNLSHANTCQTAVEEDHLLTTVGPKNLLEISDVLSHHHVALFSLSQLCWYSFVGFY